MWSMIKEGYEGLVMTVIRPLRAQYTIEDLGPKHALINDVVTHRVDLQLKNPGGYTLECSWWKPKTTEKDAKLPCIVILHGNSSCRLGGLEIVTHAIPAGFSVFALDFAGSGLSQGKYVSLGYHEQSDIATVVEYLRNSEETSSICLWGRSMGAVAALMYAQNDPQINAMVLDSPFSSLPRLATELVDEGKLGVPKIAVKLVMRLIRRDIKNRAKFDMFKLKPIAKVNKCTIPAFFVAGNQDELVGPHHVSALYKLHNGPNQLFSFQGGHNSPRPNDFFVQATQFLRVMIGLMPLHLEMCPSAVSPKKKPLKVFKNPLPQGESLDSIPGMSVKQLKEAIDRVGYGDVSCIEKQDLVDLVLKLYARHLRTSQQYSEDDLEISPRTSSLTSSPTGSAGAAKDPATGSSDSKCSTAKSPIARSQSHGNIDVSS
uniref:Serine aminopeptidase S33 domain-containing protein n=1 Tax=Globisporangium ultimum (strain ATCC 200006 / CBS 805.95 / DAOM BR144) TaxID=431595 RepID=K3XB03_GLOUD